MKTFYLLISIVLITLTSCSKKENQATSNVLVGSWKLTDILLDPGNGSGTFVPVSSNKTLIFNTNGNLTSNGNICDLSIESNTSSTGTYSESNSTINSASCQNTSIIYEVIGTTLILNYPCIEPCKAKYIKVQ
ncbi:lipocalin family protein [Flavobacterium sp.]|uniref:lipocalin family protein n=1 Tax=Flavobacterium sp. TaxID=239 RepID=UPI003BCD4364